MSVLNKERSFRKRVGWLTKKNKIIFQETLYQLFTNENRFVDLFLIWHN